MDCNEAEELFVPRLLGTLGSREIRHLECHLRTCETCSLTLQGDGETVARFAFAVPRHTVPARVKQALLAKAEAELGGRRDRSFRSVLAGVWSTWAGRRVFYFGTAVAALLVGGLLVGGLWFHDRIDRISEHNQQLSVQMAAALEREASVVEMVKDQHDLTYEALRLSAAPGAFVMTLRGSGPSPRARGMVMASRSGMRALLITLNLPPLPSDKAYQVWLMKNGQRFGSTLFTVDSTGFGQAVIIPVESLLEFDAIKVTVEPAEGSSGPTGMNVLEGDL